jgi:hypothetical protein
MANVKIVYLDEQNIKRETPILNSAKQIEFYQEKKYNQIVKIITI